MRTYKANLGSHSQLYRVVALLDTEYEDGAGRNRLWATWDWNAKLL